MNSEHLREDLAAARWYGRELRLETFAQCRMTGLEAAQIRAERLVFRDCRLDLANFRHATLRNVSFEDCVLDEADFGGADLSLTRFRGCSLLGVSFADARLTRVDLRGCALAPTTARSLRGAVISTTQLIDLGPQLAADFGIVIEDTEP